MMTIKQSEYRKRLQSRAKACDSTQAASRAHKTLMILRVARALKNLHAPLAILLLALMTIAQPAFGLAQKSKRPAPSASSTPPAPAQTIKQPTERGVNLSQIASGVAPDGRGKLWAVVIGVSNYKNLRAEEQLRFAGRDAEAFAAFLRSPNGGGFPSTQIKVLLNEAATIASVRTALGTWLTRSAEPDDVVYIFFAGHGVVEQGTDGYLLANDSDPQNLYATALPIAELDRIINERLRARVAVVIADACHAGKLGMASRGTGEQVLISRYLDEVSKSGAGSFRLLASRADERSFEDSRWGGGHGVFTHYLLEGLAGTADRDNDSVVRAGELLDYLSQVVPEQTGALQHPRAAGNLDARLPLAITANKAAPTQANVATSQPATLEVRGLPGSEVYLNSAYRGRIRPEGVLVLEGLASGNQELSIDMPGAETIKQTVALIAARTVLDLSAATPPRAAIKSSPLVPQIKDALLQGNVLEPGGAWPLYQQLTREKPDDPQRAGLEIAIIDELDGIGQKSVNNYVQTSAAPYDAKQLRQASEAYTNLKTLKPGDAQVEAKSLFARARVLLAEGKSKEAIALLEKSMTLDPRTACSWNAIGAAYEKTNNIEKALNFYKRATQLAPGWALPHHRLGLQFYARGKAKDAQREFGSAKDLDPAFLPARWWLTRSLGEQDRYSEAEREAKELIALAPNYVPAYVELGHVYQASRRFEEATEVFNKVLQLAALPAANKAAGSSATPASQQPQGQASSPKQR